MKIIVPQEFLNRFHAYVYRHGRSSILLVTLFFWWGCTPKSLSPAEYEVFLADSDNGLVQSRDVIHKIRITAKFLPAAYLTYKEMQKTGLSLTRPTYDSLKTYYQQGATYQLILESLDPKLDLEDLLYGKATETSEKSAIMANMDIELIHQLKLETKGKTYHPGLCIRESMPGMNRKVQFLMIFPVEIATMPSEQISFVWDDSFFQTGRSTLLFQVKDFVAAPEIQW